MSFSYKPYKESDAVKLARQQAEKNSTYKASKDVLAAQSAMQKLEANPVAKWTGGQYGQQLQDTMNKLQNREKFSYDLNGDALYQQYKDQYMLGGQMAMQDTMGQAAALTGGYGNSYAVNAGNQAYQGYLQKLNAVVPELYQMALNQYNQEGQELKDMYSILNQQYESEYDRHRDDVADHNAALQMAMDKYFNLSNRDVSQFNADRDYYNTRYNNERGFDYGKYTDGYNQAFSAYQQKVSEKQHNDSMKLERERLNMQKNSSNQTSYKDIPKYVMDHIDDMIYKETDEKDIAEYIFSMFSDQSFDPEDMSGLFNTYAPHYTVEGGQVKKREYAVPKNAVDLLVELQKATGKL